MDLFLLTGALEFSYMVEYPYGRIIRKSFLEHDCNGPQAASAYRAVLSSRAIYAQGW